MKRSIMQRLLITGGSGFLGQELARQALAAGWDTSATYWSHQPALPGVAWHTWRVHDGALRIALKRVDLLHAAEPLPAIEFYV